MSEPAPSDIVWEPPVLLKSADLHVYDAYSQAIDVPVLTLDQAQMLMGYIAAGQAATRWLAEAGTLDEALDRAALTAAEAKGAAAKRALVTHHLQLVPSIAVTFIRSFGVKEELAELTAAGNLGLVEAANAYVPQPDTGFAALAKLAIRHEILTHLTRERREQTGLTRAMTTMLRDIRTVHEAGLRVGIDRTFMETALYLGFNEEDVMNALHRKNTRTESIDHRPILTTGHTASFQDVWVDEDATGAVEAVENEVLIRKVWDVAREMRDKELLSGREWLILVRRFKDGMSQREVGELIDLDQANVGQWEQKVIAKLTYAVNNPETLLIPEVVLPQRVQLAIDLLAILRIPCPKGANPREMATEIINAAALTDHERQILHCLLGTGGQKQIGVSQLADHLGVRPTGISSARTRAVEKIIAGYGKTESDDLTDLLYQYGIPVPEGPDVRAATRDLLEKAHLTDRQREILSRILGLDDGKPISVNALAKEQGTAEGSIRRARDRALFNLLNTIPGATAKPPRDNHNRKKKSE